MNKYQEAFENIVWEIRISRRNPKNIEDIKANLDLLQELVDKETPLNLPLHHGVYMQCKCEAMSEIHSNYCWNCGQALDWSEE